MNNINENNLKRINGVVITITIILMLIIPIVLSSNIREKQILDIIIAYSILIILNLLITAGIYYKNKKENLDVTKKLQLVYKPILKLSKTRNNDNLVNEINIITNSNNYRNNNLKKGHYFLEIRNTGKGEMIDIKLKDLKVENIDNNSKTEGYFKNNNIIDNLIVNDSIVLEIKTPENIYNNDILTTYNVSFIIEYKGILNNKTIKDKVSFKISNNNKSKNDIYDFKIKDLL